MRRKILTQTVVGDLRLREDYYLYFNAWDLFLIHSALYEHAAIIFYNMYCVNKNKIFLRSPIYVGLFLFFSQEYMD